MRIKSIAQLVLSVSFLILAQCGGEDADVEAVDFSHSPGDPIVIESNFVYTLPATTPGGAPTPVTVLGPFFFSRPVFANSSDKILVVQSVKYTIEATDTETGAAITFTYFTDYLQKDINRDTDVTNDEPYVAIIQPGESSDLNANNNTQWIIGGLPNRTRVNPLSYTVRMEALGWFGDYNDPQKPFRKLLVVRASEN